MMGFVTLVLAVGTGIVLVAAVPALRRPVLTGRIFRAFRRALPSMSQTEREALEAGTVWWEGELFAGRPEWGRFLAYPWPRLTPEEQRFLDEFGRSSDQASLYTRALDTLAMR